MAFDQSTFAPIGAHSSDTPNLFSYKTSDKLSEIVLKNYFFEKRHQLQVNDFMLVFAADGSGFYEVDATLTGVQSVSENLSRTAFGELAVAEPTPIVQATAQYGLTGKVFTFNTPGSTAIAEDSLFKCNSGTNSISTATITSDRRITYRPGQGISARFTALFSTPQPGSIQAAGLISATDALVVGYAGEVFGFIHGHGGAVEIQELTISTGAGGSENATITIDGTGYTVPLTAGTVQHNAFEISESLNSQVLGYNFSSNDDAVVAASLLAEPQGAFSMSSATAAGTFSQVAAGVVRTDDFYPQDEWSVNPFPDLIPGFGNVFEIKYQYLGFGGIELYVEDPETSHYVLAHRIQYANSSSETSVTDPIFRVGWAAINAGNTTPVEVAGGSLAAFVEGKVHIRSGSVASDNVVTAVPVAGTTNLLAIRNRLVFGSKRNRTETRPLIFSASTDSNKGANIRIFLNPVFSAPVVFDYLDKDDSTTEVAKDAVLVTGGAFVGGFTTTQAGTIVNLDELSSIILADDTLVFTGSTASGSAADINISVTLREDL